MVRFGCVKTMLKKFTTTEIKKQITAVPLWKVVQGKLHREFVFTDFNEAFSFMIKVAAIAKKIDHHPEWSNVYKKVKVYLSTHNVRGISELDFKLARRIDLLV